MQIESGLVEPVQEENQTPYPLPALCRLSSTKISVPSEAHEREKIFKVGKLHFLPLRCAATLITACLGVATMEARLNMQMCPLIYSGEAYVLRLRHEAMELHRVPPPPNLTACSASTLWMSTCQAHLEIHRHIQLCNLPGKKAQAIRCSKPWGTEACVCVVHIVVLTLLLSWNLQELPEFLPKVQQSLT